MGLHSSSPSLYDETIAKYQVMTDPEQGTFTSVGLTAAKGKEGFYERFGFNKSAGMTKYIEKAEERV